MTYAKQTWLNSPPSKDTPLSAARFNHMEDGIEAADSVAAAAVPSTRKINGQALSGDVTLIASDVDLGNVDNTSDSDKPISTATAAALALKSDADETVSGSANGTAANLTLWTGTDAQFAAVTEKDPATVYVRPGGISIGASPVFTGVPRTYTVTVDHTKVSAAVSDFPLFVDLSTMPGVFWSAVSNDGGDIRCYAGATELAREVVSCDTIARKGELHIKCDLSATADTAITITVDGSSPDYAPTDPYGRNAVWSNGFVVVSHDGGLSDSTANGFDGTVVGTIGGQTNGKLGDTTQKYIGLGYVDLGNDPKLKLNNGTLSLWMQENVPSTGAAKNLISKSLAYGMNTQGTDLLVFNWGAPVGNNRDVGGANVADGSWHYATHTFQSGVANGSSIFLDGANLLNFSMSVSAQTEKLTVGGASPTGDASEIADALLDEVRIANVVRSAAWIAAEYANQNTPSSFYTTAPA